MAAIRFKNKHNGYTMLSNRFIDEYMPFASGEYVKVYLYLLRQAGLSEPHVSVEDIAEHLMHTEKDIIRALKYWEKQGLLAASFTENQECESIELLFPDAGSSSKSVSKTTSTEVKKSAVSADPPTGSWRQENASVRQTREGDHAFSGSDSTPGFVGSSSGFQTVSADHNSGGTGQESDSNGQRIGFTGQEPGYAGQESLSASQKPLGADQEPDYAGQGSDFVSSGAANLPVGCKPADASSASNADRRRGDSIFTASQSPPPRRNYTPQEIEEITERESLEEMIFVINSYMGRPLSQTELTSMIYFYDQLGFSIELIEYLFEYCISKNHKSIRYIEKTALNWAEEHITTPEEARQQTAGHSEDCFAVLKAFGISGRNPVESEIRFVKLWRDDYHMTTELIVDACSRTMAQIHSPSFEYADGILSGWKNAGVKSLEDVKKLDEAFAAKKQSGSGRSANRRNRGTADTMRGGKGGSQTKFSNFEERSYSADDEADLEKLLLARYRGQSSGT